VWATLTAGDADAAGTTAMSPEEMDRMEEAVMAAFPAKTSATGGKVLASTISKGIKTFELTTSAIRWEVAPGQMIDAYAFNGQVPGPEIRVRKGDKIKVVVHNELPESTSVHFHGLTIPNAMDGVPFLTQPPIKMGESFTYSFTIKDDPGTYMYHSHKNALTQVGKGLLGAFVVEPAHARYDVEETMVLGDGPLGYTLNGKGFPATAPISVKRNDTVLVRFMNAGQMLHPMHLHGFHFSVVARDARPVDPYVLDTLVVAPGERYDVVFTADLPGAWAFHCHILSHVESEHGMHGMVTAVIVT
jgi:manganese oxidase